MSSTKPRPPKLNKLKGTYEIPKTLREEAQINSSILLEPAREWGNIKSVVDSYLGVSLVWERTGADFLSLLQASFRQISKTLKQQPSSASSASSSLLAEYISSLVTYYKNDKIKHDVSALYQQVELQRRVERNNAETALQAESTMSVLMTQKGREKEDAIRGVPSNDADTVSSQQSDSTVSSEASSGVVVFGKASSRGMVSDDLDTINSVAFGSEDSVSDEEFTAPDGPSSQDSSESLQHKIPPNRQALYYLSTVEGSYEFKLNRSSKTWLSTSGFDISRSFMKFRDKCVARAEDLKELNQYETLALDGILVIDDNIHTEIYVPLEEIEYLLQAIDAIDYFKIPELEEAEANICDRFARRMKSKVVDADQVENDVDQWCRLLPNQGVDTKRLNNVLCEFSSTYSGDYSITSVNEATLVRDTIDMLLKQYIKSSPIMKCLGADNMILASSVRFTKSDPSLVNHGKRADFSVVSAREKHLLMALECKKHGSALSGDFVKLARELKDSLKMINESGYADVPVIGLLLKGASCSIYVMDHRFDGVYRMVLVDMIFMPRNRYDLSGVKDIIAAMKKLKTVVSLSARVVNRPVDDDDDLDLPLNMMSFHSPVNVDRLKKVDLNPSHPMVKRARRKLVFEK
ncbi:hypothetical protein MBANPS3_010261 [Mucor bainieri]